MFFLAPRQLFEFFLREVHLHILKIGILLIVVNTDQLYRFLVLFSRHPL